MFGNCLVKQFAICLGVVVIYVRVKPVIPVCL